MFRVFFNFLRRSLILNYTMEVKTEKLNDNKNKSSKLAGSTEKYPQRCIAAFNCIKEKLKNTKKVTRYGIILSLMHKHKDDDIYKAVLFKLWRSRNKGKISYRKFAEVVGDFYDSGMYSRMIRYCDFIQAHRAFVKYPESLLRSFLSQTRKLENREQIYKQAEESLKDDSLSSSTLKKKLKALTDSYIPSIPKPSKEEMFFEYFENVSDHEKLRIIGKLEAYLREVRASLKAEGNGKEEDSSSDGSSKSTEKTGDANADNVKLDSGATNDPSKASPTEVVIANSAGIAEDTSNFQDKKEDNSHSGLDEMWENLGREYAKQLAQDAQYDDYTEEMYNKFMNDKPETSETDNTIFSQVTAILEKIKCKSLDRDIGAKKIIDIFDSLEGYKQYKGNPHNYDVKIAWDLVKGEISPNILIGVTEYIGFRERMKASSFPGKTV